MSRIRTNLITNRMANGAPTVSNGLVIAGVTTVTTLDLNGDLDVDGHLNADNVSIAGVVTATSFVGSGANLTGITQTTINNNADNRLITGSGTANTLEGESTITYSNPTLEINTDTSPYGALTLNGNSGGLIQFEDNETSKWQIFGDSAFNIYDDVNNASRLYINSSGQMGLSGTPTHKLEIFNGSDTQNILMIRGADTTTEYAAMGVHGGNAVITGGGVGSTNAGIIFRTAGSGSEAERLRIDSSGNVMIGRTTASKKFSIKESSTSSGVYINQTVGGSSHLTGYAVGIGFDPEGYEARTKIAIVAEGTGSGYSRGKLHFLLDEVNDGGEATLSESRMTITDSGQVTKPSQPSFAVYRNQDGYSLNNQIFPFNTVRHNIGSHFNTGNHRFTAPVAGRYLFTFYSILNSQVNSGHYSIRVNNSTSYGMNIHFTTVNTHWDNVHNSQIINLNANDYVTMWSNSSIGWHGNAWSIFTGELLS